MVEIAIKDSGIGMSPEKVENLFQIEKSLSRPGTNNEMGTGLGLLLVKEFVEQNKGEIHVTSEVNKGTTITFTLPLNNPAPAS
jgi:two-component system sensor histidine kinase/response regulator